MAMNQSMQQKLLQKLSPQQIQLMKLLQVPTAILDERIKEEIEENPALEQGEDGHEDEYESDEFETPAEEEFERDGSEEDYDNIDITDYVQEGDDDVGDYRLKDENYPEIDDNRVIPHKVETSFIELMLQQLGMLKLTDQQRMIAEQLVGSLDDDGYLRREISSIIDDLAFRQNIDSNEEEISELLLEIQQFDPPGVGARNLQECLILQLERKIDKGESVALALKVMEKYFDEFTKKHYEKIQRGLNIDDEQLREVIQQIVKLNPKPGGIVGDEGKNNNYVIADFFITNNNGKLELTLNSKNA
ncbi:MAG: RNA polymerase sigma-54 factor, partial [Ferruginibacter sp.]